MHENDKGLLKVSLKTLFAGVLFESLLINYTFKYVCQFYACSRGSNGTLSNLTPGNYFLENFSDLLKCCKKHLNA